MFVNYPLFKDSRKNVFAKKAVREYRILFEIGGEVPNREVQEMKKNPSIGKAYTRVMQKCIIVKKGTSWLSGFYCFLCRILRLLFRHEICNKRYIYLAKKLISCVIV